MAWIPVLSLVNAANLTAANIKLQQIYGDPPGSDELGSLNASSDGNPPATVNICQGSLSNLANSSHSDTSKSMLDDWTDYLDGLTGCQFHVYEPGDPIDGWADAGSLWGAFQVIEI